VCGCAATRYRALDPALEQVEAQSANPGTNVEKDAVNSAGVDEHVPQQASGRARPILAVTLQVTPGDLLVEMCARDIAVRRATCAHQITFIVNAACGRRRSRRRRHTSWQLVLWRSRESN